MKIKCTKLLEFLLFIFVFGLMPQAAHAFKGSTCTPTNKVNTWDSNTDWTCPGVGSGTIGRLYDSGYRVVLVSSTTDSGNTEGRTFRGRELGVPKVLPILIIEEQPKAPPEQKGYDCVLFTGKMDCSVKK